MSLRIIAVVGAAVALSACGGGAGGSDTGAIQLSAEDARANDVMAECLLDAGFPVTRGAGGEVQFVDPEDTQFSDYEAARRTCGQQLVELGLVPEVTEADLRREYALAADLHACLVTAGFPLIDLPSEQVYVEQRAETNVLEATAPIELSDVQGSCPDEYAALERR